MMTTKGTSLIVLPEFIKQTFGEEAKNKWLAALSPEANKYFSDLIMPASIYPLKTGMIEPTEKMCELFYGGNTNGAFELGKFSADYALKGVYRFFIKFGSPEFIIKKSGTILPVYYQPSKMEITEVENGHAVLRIVDFAEMAEVVEKRITGWMDKAMEVTGAKNGRIVTTKSLTKGDPITEFDITWEK